MQSGFGVYISLVESAFSRVNDHSIERKEKETRGLEKKIRSRFSFRASVLYITLALRSFLFEIRGGFVVGEGIEV